MSKEDEFDSEGLHRGGGDKRKEKITTSRQH